MTREGTMEGPFGSEQEAHNHLETYIKLMKSRALDGGSIKYRIFHLAA